MNTTTINTALARYGAELNTDGFITRDGKTMSVRADIVKGRLRLSSGKTGLLVASYPAARIDAGIADFVEKFWFWKPRA